MGEYGAGAMGSNKLFVGNIGWWVNEEDLLQWFGRFGRITGIKVNTGEGGRGRAWDGMGWDGRGRGYHLSM